ncbi:MAG: DNA topoisomerase IB [Acidobacteriota bacterium]
MPARSLVYVDPEAPGIVRQRRGKGFGYRAPDGHWLSPRDPTDREHLARIRSLAIPPAYHHVWICPHPLGHLQATGRDARGRKQYRYHPDWTLARGADKFSRMQAFGAALPALRQHIQQELQAPPVTSGPGRDRVLATLVHLLDTTHVRVGNEVYARDNHSYGLTTLRNQHAKVSGSTVALQFRGKSGVWHDIRIDDAKVARVVRRCQQLPGQELFTYRDPDGEVHRIGSTEVNDYIRALTQGDFSAKDFRTWHATVHAWSLMQPDQNEPTPAPWPASRINEAIKCVAHALGNTPAVCKKSYIHPAVLRCAQSGQWPCGGTPAAPADLWLSEAEAGLLCFLATVAQEAPVSLKKTSTRRLRARP